MGVELLTEHHLDFLSLKGGCTGSYGSTLVNVTHCWKSFGVAHLAIGFNAWRYITPVGRSYRIVKLKTFSSGEFRTPFCGDQVLSLRVIVLVSHYH